MGKRKWVCCRSMNFENRWLSHGLLQTSMILVLWKKIKERRSVKEIAIAIALYGQ